MKTAGVCTRAYSKAEQRNSEGEWEALTSFKKNKQIRTGGKVQGGAPSTMPASKIEGEPKEQISMRDWADPQKPTKTLNERREGSKDEEEPPLPAVFYGDLGEEHYTQHEG